MRHLLTISDAVATHARLIPNKLGTRDSRRSLSYAQWHERASRLAAGLLTLGLNKGDRVGVLAYNCVEWMEIYVALARSGLVAVPLNVRLTGPEMIYILDHSEARAVIAGAEFHDALQAIRAAVHIEPGCFVLIGENLFSREGSVTKAPSRRPAPRIGLMQWTPTRLAPCFTPPAQPVGLKASSAVMLAAPSWLWRPQWKWGLAAPTRLSS